MIHSYYSKGFLLAVSCDNSWDVRKFQVVVGGGFAVDNLLLGQSISQFVRKNFNFYVQILFTKCVLFQFTGQIKYLHRQQSQKNCFFLFKKRY